MSELPMITPLATRRSVAAQQRVGDLERAGVCDELSAQYAAGRLGPEELEERLSLAVAARTRGDLGGLLADLPTLEVPPTPSPQPAPAAVTRTTADWNVLDVVALLAVIGCALVAALGAFAVIVAGVPGYAWAAFLSSLVAAVGAAAATHLVHRSLTRHEAKLRARG